MATAPQPEASAPAASAATARVYYPELDGLRFFAFLLVFLFHGGIPQPELARLVGSRLARAFHENGWVGVQIFFVLSGFLITALLVREQARFGKVDLPAFWARRILRIWPLFYLTIVIVFGLIPWCDGLLSASGGRQAVLKHLPWFLLFLGNWSMILQGPVVNDAQSVLWSVCVEEQFYVIIPLLVALMLGRARLAVVLVLMALAVGTRHVLAVRNMHDFWIQYNSLAQFDTLLAGVALALVLARYPPGPRAARVAQVAQWPLYAALAWLFTRSNLAHGEAWRRTWDFVAIWAGALGIVAVAVLHVGWLRAVLAHRWLVWLGKISYGLYMYHEVALWLRARLEMHLGWFPNRELLLAIGGFAGTILMAAASYYGYERVFLQLKKRWTRVPSRPV